MHWSEIWESDRLSARLLRTVLLPLSWLYSAVWQGYLLAYRVGLKRAAEPHFPVLCIGNLVAGGTGKSPVTLFTARLLEALGYSVVIGCSGYGAPHSEGAALAPEGDLDPAEWGDETAMMRWLMPTIPLIVGRARVKAAEICHVNFPQAVLLMDDGFQHLPVRKHLAILLDPARRNRNCLPAGPYREPWKNRRRADLVLPNGFHVALRISAFDPVTGDQPATLSQGPVDLVCAIGDPARFVRDLEALGLEPRSVVCRPDHAGLQEGNLMDPFDGSRPVVTTAKDWVKLRRRPDIQQHRVFIARQEARIEPEDEFRAWLQRELDELTKKSPVG